MRIIFVHVRSTDTQVVLLQIKYPIGQRDGTTTEYYGVVLCGFPSHWRRLVFGHLTGFSLGAASTERTPLPQPPLPSHPYLFHHSGRSDNCILSFKSLRSRSFFLLALGLTLPITESLLTVKATRFSFPLQRFFAVLTIVTQKANIRLRSRNTD